MTETQGTERAVGAERAWTWRGVLRGAGRTALQALGGGMAGFAASEIAVASRLFDRRSLIELYAHHDGFGFISERAAEMTILGEGAVTVAASVGAIAVGYARRHRDELTLPDFSVEAGDALDEEPVEPHLELVHSAPAGE